MLILGFPSCRSSRRLRKAPRLLAMRLVLAVLMLHLVFRRSRLIRWRRHGLVRLVEGVVVQRCLRLAEEAVLQAEEVVLQAEEAVHQVKGVVRRVEEAVLQGRQGLVVPFAKMLSAWKP